MYARAAPGVRLWRTSKVPPPWWRSADLATLGLSASRIEQWNDVPAVSEDVGRARDVIVDRVERLFDDDTRGR